MSAVDEIRNLIVLGKIDRPGLRPQIKWAGERAAPEVRHLQGPGIDFIAPKDATGVLLAPAADPGAAVAVGYDGPKPVDEEEEGPGGERVEGEGGLHYLGEWKVFISADGKLHLGERDPTDFVALATLVRQALLEIKDDFDNHTHVCAGSGSPSDTPAQPMRDPIDVGSEKVKCG